MIKDGGLSFETQLKIEFLPLNNGSKKSMQYFKVLSNLCATVTLHKKLATCFNFL